MPSELEAAFPLDELADLPWEDIKWLADLWGRDIELVDERGGSIAVIYRCAPEPRDL